MWSSSSKKLNERSMKIVKTVYNNMKSHPTYTGFTVTIDEYDIEGSASITLTKNGQNVNKFYFYPKHGNGNIESIAIYGAQLNGHFSSINGSKNVFGLKVSEIEIVTNSASPFVDVYIEDY